MHSHPGDGPLGQIRSDHVRSFGFWNSGADRTIPNDIWQWVKTLGTPGEPQNSWDLWMFIPLKMVLIGIDPNNISQEVRFWFSLAQLQRQTRGIHSSGLACRASTGINLPTCSATAAPALRSLKTTLFRCVARSRVPQWLGRGKNQAQKPEKRRLKPNSHCCWELWI